MIGMIPRYLPIHHLIKRFLRAQTPSQNINSDQRPLFIKERSSLKFGALDLSLSIAVSRTYFAPPYEISYLVYLWLTMADRTSRSATRRTTPQSPRVPQSPPRQILRSMTSRSIDSQSSRVGLKHGHKKARQVTRTEATTDYNGLQHARQGEGRAQSRPLQGEPTQNLILLSILRLNASQ